MKRFWFNFLILTGLLTFSGCDSGICSCGDACTVSANGQLSCSLDAKSLEKRKAVIQKSFISKAEKVKETEDGFRFIFKDEGKMNEQLFDFILTEKKCCPFFQYDIQILPYQEGIHLTISGDKEVKVFLKNIFTE